MDVRHNVSFTSFAPQALLLERPSDLLAPRFVDLQGAECIAAGNERKVYVDPLFPDRCLKVSPFGVAKQYREDVAQQAFIQRLGKSMAHLPAYYGPVDCEQGMALSFELVRDWDGSVSRTVYEHMLECRSLTQLQAMLDALFVFKQYLLDNTLIVRDLNTKNLLLQRRWNGLRIVMIDGVGNSEFIPLSNYIAPLARRKIERKWARLDKAILRSLPDDAEMLALVKSMFP